MRISTATASVGALLALLAGISLGWAGGRNGWWRPDASAAGPEGFAVAAAMVEPSVVTVRVESPGMAVEGIFSIPGGPTLGGGVPHTLHGVGTGLIVDPRGYIVTNRHVISNAERIQVNLGANSDNPFLAHLVGVDPDSDLAVIKIETPHRLLAARFGDSDRLRVGDWVEAIGSPFDFDHTVTAGIISALNRGSEKLPESTQYEHFIQTDAAINPGNSGGPLITPAGEVVGINTAIFSDSNAYQGIGFALPSKLVQAVVAQLMRQGKIVRGSIGVYYQPTLDPAVRRVYGLQAGVPVSEVQKGGPADLAGIRAGDIITTLNGSPVWDGDDLVSRIVYAPTGHPVRIGYLRDGTLHTTNAIVLDRTQIFGTTGDEAAAVAMPAPRPPAPFMGLTMHDSSQPPGAQVDGVAPDSFAYRIHLSPGDVIVEFNRIAINGRAPLQALIDQVREGQDVAMVVLRPGSQGMRRQYVGGPYQP